MHRTLDKYFSPENLTDIERFVTVHYFENEALVKDSCYVTVMENEGEEEIKWAVAEKLGIEKDDIDKVNY